MRAVRDARAPAAGHVLGRAASAVAPVPLLKQLTLPPLLLLLLLLLQSCFGRARCGWRTCGCARTRCTSRSRACGQQQQRMWSAWATSAPSAGAACSQAAALVLLVARPPA
jgi:hypothetical protein